MSRPEISVVVCIDSRSCCRWSHLEALEQQTLEAARYEVVVVDHASSDDTAARVDEIVRRNHNFVYLCEQHQGLSIARNTGVAKSSAGIIAFTAGGAIPEDNWLQLISDRFSRLSDGVAMIGGDVIPVWETERPRWLSDRLLRPLSAGLRWSVEPRYLRHGEWLVDVNSAYRKDRLVAAGGFPEELPPVGEMGPSGEDAMSLLLDRCGIPLFYDPAIVVRRRIPARRLTKEWFRRNAFWRGVTMNLIERYIEEKAGALGAAEPPAEAAPWQDVTVPISAQAWADLFDDRSSTGFEHQLDMLKQLGYLLQSQKLVFGCATELLRSSAESRRESMAEPRDWQCRSR